MLVDFLNPLWSWKNWNSFKSPNVCHSYSLDIRGIETDQWEGLLQNLWEFAGEIDQSEGLFVCGDLHDRASDWGVDRGKSGCSPSDTNWLWG